MLVSTFLYLEKNTKCNFIIKTDWGTTATKYKFQNLICDPLPDLPYSLDGASGHLLNNHSVVVCGGFKGDFPSCQCHIYNNNSIVNNNNNNSNGNSSINTIYNNNKTWVNFVNTTDCRGYASSAVLTSSAVNETLMIVGGSSKTGPNL